MSVTEKGKCFILITLGSIIYAAGVAIFFDPNSIVTGGISGIAIMLSKFTPAMTVGTWTVVLNIPIILTALYKFGFKFLATTVYALLLSSLCMNFFTVFVGAVTNDILLSCAAGAALSALGIGLVFRGGATTGGSDIVIKLLRLRFRRINTASMFLIVDMTIVLISGLIFRNADTVLYALIAVIIHAQIMNIVLYGTDEVRLLYIISRQNDVIAKRLMTELESGITYIQGKGAYTDNKNEIIMCVIHTKLLPNARDIVKSEDSKAFMIVTAALAVFGEGYKSYFSEEL